MTRGTARRGASLTPQPCGGPAQLWLISNLIVMVRVKRSRDELTRVTVTSFEHGNRQGPSTVLYDVDVPASQAAESAMSWLATSELDPSGDVATMVRENALSTKRPPARFLAMAVERESTGLLVLVTWTGAKLPSDLVALAARPSRA